MEKYTNSFVQVCPIESNKIARKLIEIDFVLDESIEVIKNEINIVIDQREFNELDKLQRLIKSIDEIQEKLGRYTELLSLTKEDITSVTDKEKDTILPHKIKRNTGMRQRGIVVRVNESVIVANTVREYYTKVLESLDASGMLELFDPLLPYATSSKRYLICKDPVHPNGNQFETPIEYKGFFMEAHKSYETASSALEKLLMEIGADFEVLESKF